MGIAQSDGQGRAGLELRRQLYARHPARAGEIDAKHAQLMSAFLAATQSGDLDALTQLLASDVRVVTDGGGKVRAALDVIDGADRVAEFLIDAARKRPGTGPVVNHGRKAGLRGLGG